MRPSRPAAARLTSRAASFKRHSVVRRDTIYKPVFDDRLQRLSDKLQAIAASEIPVGSYPRARPCPPPARAKNFARTDPKKADAMDVETEKPADAAVDADATTTPLSTYKKRAQKGKVSRNRHARNAVIFPNLRNGVTKSSLKTAKNKKKSK